MVLNSKLIKRVIVEAAEFRSQPTEGPDESELRSDDVNDEAEPRLLRKREALLGFPLHLGERISRCKKFVIKLVQL